MKFIQKLLGLKDSQTRMALSFRSVGQPQVTPANYEAFARQGYSKNVIVYRCIDIIATAAAGIEWELYQKTRAGDPIELKEHPLLTLLKRPNPMQGGSSFFQYVVAFYKLTGNTFIEGVRPRPNQPPMELWPVRPDRMQIVPGPRGYPLSYVLSTGEMKKVFPVDQIKLQSDMFHMKSFNPTNEWWGLSPMESAMLSVDTTNASSRWNLALVQNSAVPSGVLQVKATDINPGGTLSEEQFSRLKSELDDSYSGQHNAGRPMLIEGNLEWKQISLSPTDMDFLNSKNVSNIDICEAFGVPPEMLGLGQKTFNNYKEARMSFYEDTVLPLMDQLKDELNNWLVPMFGDGLYLKYNQDDIEALAPKREQKFTSVQNASWLTVNEKREATGYEPKPGWDVFVLGQELITDPESYMAEPLPPPAPEPVAPPIVDEPDDEDDDQDLDEGEKGWKNFNLLNQRERRASWKNQNRRRMRLEKAFSRDLNSDFEELYKDMLKAAEGVSDVKLLEYAMLKELDKNIPNLQKTIRRYVKYTIDDFGTVIFNDAKSLFGHIETKSQRQWNDWAERYISKRTGDAVSTIDGTTKKQVQRVVKRITEQSVIDGDSIRDAARELQDEFVTLSKSRATLIARTEVASASNNASLEAVKSLEIPSIQKEWIASSDDRVRDGGKDGNGPDHESMSGVSVPLDEKFAVPPDASMDGPGDMAGGASQVCNCRCVLVFNTRG